VITLRIRNRFSIPILLSAFALLLGTSLAVKVPPGPGQAQENEIVKIGEGETLEIIALRNFGDESAAQEIRVLNSLLPGDQPAPGTEIKIPSRSERKLAVAAIEKVSTIIAQLELMGLSPEEQKKLEEATGIRESCKSHLKKAEYAKVLELGDQAITLLNWVDKKLSGRTVLDIEIRDTKTGQNESLFSVQKGNVKIQTQKENVTLKGGEAGIVDETGDKIQVRKLLDPPEPVDPETGKVFYQTGISLSWTKLGGATSYLIEIANDPRFSRVYLERTNATTTLWLANDVSDGKYFWRVRGVDPQGIVGRSSKNSSFEIRIDQTPPDIEVDVPIWK
jgi:hypothetical protein